MYERILVPVDGSPTSDLGLKEAIKLGKLTGASLKLLHVLDDLSVISSFESGAALTAEMIDVLRAKGEQVLQAAKASCEENGVTTEAELIESLLARVSDVVIEKAREWKAQLIVIGTHGRRGVGRVLLGSDAEQIARQSPVPVLLVRGA
jgi:nucleotide-binding universal stress UspA family protein